MYSTGPDSDASAPASSRSVDLPTPGSPASSTTAPGTSPPPRTRSSSSSPVGRTLAARESTSVMGTAGAAATATTCAMLRTPDPSRARPAVSSTVPHAWHPPQRPDHLVVRQPHSAQRYVGPADDFPMPGTVTTGCDTPESQAGGSWPGPGRGAGRDQKKRAMPDLPPWRRDGSERKNDAEISAVIFGF